MEDQRPSACAECGEQIGWANVGRDLVQISRIQVLGFSKGLPGPAVGFSMPLSHNVNRDRTEIRFVDGQDLMVRHENVCGRKRKRR